MISSTYQPGDYARREEVGTKKTTVTMSLEELLPMSFGPDELEMGHKE